MACSRLSFRATTRCTPLWRRGSRGPLLAAQLPDHDGGAKTSITEVQAKADQDDRGREHPGSNGDRGLDRHPGHAGVFQPEPAASEPGQLTCCDRRPSRRRGAARLAGRPCFSLLRIANPQDRARCRSHGPGQSSGLPALRHARHTRRRCRSRCDAGTKDARSALWRGRMVLIPPRRSRWRRSGRGRWTRRF
jgi:hypothetical protein